VWTAVLRLSFLVNAVPMQKLTVESAYIAARTPALLDSKSYRSLLQSSLILARRLHHDAG